MKRIMVLSIIADISLLGCLVYYFGWAKGSVLFALSCAIGAVTGMLARR